MVRKEKILWSFTEIIVLFDLLRLKKEDLKSENFFLFYFLNFLTFENEQVTIISLEKLKNQKKPLKIAHFNPIF